MENKLIGTCKRILGKEKCGSLLPEDLACKL